MSFEACFLICPIGDEGSEIRKSSDQWVRHVVRPVAEKFGYAVQRADDMPKSGIITNQVVQAILEAHLVIADLSGHNPNVFYELALRHATRKPFIQMIKKGQAVPFDIQGVRTIPYDLSDPDNLKTASVTLARHIKEIGNGHQVDSPVSMAVARSLFEAESSNAVVVFLEKFWSLEASLEYILSGIEGVQEDLENVAHEISEIEGTVSDIGRRSEDIDSGLGRATPDIERIKRELQQIKKNIQGQA